MSHSDCVQSVQDFKRRANSRSRIFGKFNTSLLKIWIAAYIFTDIHIEGLIAGNDSRRRYVTTCAPQKYFEANPYEDIVGRRSTSRSGQTTTTSAGVGKRFHVAFPGPAEGPNSGCFDRFPKYSSEPYRDEFKIRKSKTSGNKWRPVGCDSRSKFTCSVIDRVTRVACNAANFTDYRVQVYSLWWMLDLSSNH